MKCPLFSIILGAFRNDISVTPLCLMSIAQKRRPVLLPSLAGYKAHIWFGYSKNKKFCRECVKSTRSIFCTLVRLPLKNRSRRKKRNKSHKTEAVRFASFSKTSNFDVIPIAQFK